MSPGLKAKFDFFKNVLGINLMPFSEGKNFGEEICVLYLFLLYTYIRYAERRRHVWSPPSVNCNMLPWQKKFRKF